MTLRPILLICFIFTAAFAHAQPAGSDSTFRFLSSYRGEISDFTVDNLGNLYILFQNGQLKKLRPNGDSMAVFNNVRKFGKVHSVDVSNPLKALMYYRDFGTVVILDRLLNQRAVLDLRKANLFQVKAIGQSYDNNIWVFDELELKLKKIGDDGRLIDQSTDFRLVFDSVPSPERIVDQDKFVYLYDPGKGVYVFDYFGGYQNRVPFTGWKDFNVIGNAIFGRDAGYLYRYEMGSLQLRQYPIPEFMTNSRKIVIAPGNVYMLGSEGLNIFTYR